MHTGLSKVTASQLLARLEERGLVRVAGEQAGGRGPVTIENDVNLAAMAERATGTAAGADDFVLVWIGIGIGLAIVLDGRLHRGVGGAAGEIGYLPVPGVPLPQDVSHPATGLGGEVGLGGGTALAERVAAEVARISPTRPHVAATSVTGNPVLRGAIRAAVDQARGELLASVSSP